MPRSRSAFNVPTICWRLNSHSPGVCVRMWSSASFTLPSNASWMACSHTASWFLVLRPLGDVLSMVMLCKT
ncbi:hypothetical protein [Geminiviridae sp.]|nr:hypothetical protein [Geminiviridae sp.]